MRMLLALSLLPLLAACGTPTAPGALEASSSSSVSIVQDGYGKSARFVLCDDSSCPGITPKTPERMTPAPAATPALVVVQEPAAPKSETLVTQPPAPISQHYVIQFATGQSMLTPKALAVLDDALGNVTGADRIEIRGRTDITGSKRLNNRLALKRAVAVRQYLLRSNKLAGVQVRVDATGQCCYLAPNESDAGRQLNRRAELDIYVVPTQKSQE